MCGIAGIILQPQRRLPDLAERLCGLGAGGGDTTAGDVCLCHS